MLFYNPTNSAIVKMLLIFKSKTFTIYTILYQDLHDNYDNETDIKIETKVCFEVTGIPSFFISITFEYMPVAYIQPDKNIDNGYCDVMTPY